MPARGLPKPPPTSPRQESAEFTRGGARTQYAYAKSSRGIGTRREGGGGNSEKLCDTLMD